MVSLNEVEKSQQKMTGVINRTLLDYSKTFSEYANNEIYLKLENLQ